MWKLLARLLGIGAEEAPAAWPIIKGVGKRAGQIATPLLMTSWGMNEYSDLHKPGHLLGPEADYSPDLSSIPQEYMMPPGERYEYERNKANVMLGERAERQKAVSGGGVKPSTELMMNALLTGQMPGVDDLAVRRQMLSQILFEDKDRLDKATQPDKMPNSFLG